MSHAPGAGSGRGQPAPSINMAMSGMSTGMVYHGYQVPSGFTFPPQAMSIPSIPAGASGGLPMMTPPESYTTHEMAALEKNASTHICTVHPPGMPRAFDVPFPERRLPVCDRCKKNFKSRDLCRKRDGHKALPWQTTYIAVTITESALEMGRNGSLTHADIPVVTELQETPLMCLGPADGSMKMEPICKVCREKNYTRDYCRNTCKHTTPPWSTTYVKLVVDKTPKDDHKFKYPKKRKKNQEENADGKPKADLNNLDKDKEDKSDDLSEIHKSKTFLAAISSKKMIIQWCERIQYPVLLDLDESAERALQSSSAGSVMVPHMNLTINPSIQHQNSQLWDAFRAGAIWAQSQGGQVPAGYGAMTNPNVGHSVTFFSQTPAGGVHLDGYQSEVTGVQIPSNRRNKPIEEDCASAVNVGE